MERRGRFFARDYLVGIAPDQEAHGIGRRLKGALPPWQEPRQNCANKYRMASPGSRTLPTLALVWWLP